MKVEEKKKARELRCQGMSMGDIARSVGAAKSTVSLWVRDIKLTNEQILTLAARNPAAGRANWDREKVIETWKNKRLEYQERGREMARRFAENKDFVIGCMLYWAEGAKDRSVPMFCNSDPAMMAIYMNFLRKYFSDVDEERLRVSITCYLDCGMTLEEIQDYWLKVLDLQRSNLRKCVVDKYPKLSNRKRKRKLPHGVCRVQGGGVETIQAIYGAIQELIGIDKPEWAE